MMSTIISCHIETGYRKKFATSQRLYARGCEMFPNGVTHDSRYLKPFPVYVKDASGSLKHDVDGNELIDYWMGHGSLLLGHNCPVVVDAVRHQVGQVMHPGACHELELEWGQRVQSLCPSAEMVRFTNSGTEATLMAVRVARIISGKTKVIKFAGNFHGWHDVLVPASEPPHDGVVPGVPKGVVKDLVIVPPNDLAAVAAAIEEHDPACVIHEGHGPRWGVVPVRAEFMQKLRQLTQEKQVVFILDEVITGFRVHPGGFQAHCQITPDLTTFAKVLAGGMPGGCLGGREDLLQSIAFDNSLGKKMKHPGTYNGNPLSAAAGIAMLDIVADGQPSELANKTAKRLRAGLNELFARKDVNWIAYGDFSMIKIHPDYDGPRPDSDTFIPFGGDYRQLDRVFDSALGHAFRCALLLGGVDWMGWGGMTSAAHRDVDIERTISGFSSAIDLLREDGFVD